MNPFYNFYNNRLQNKIKQHPLPEHIGVILDGNRRYAKKLGLPVKMGHALGAKKLKPLISWCTELGIKHLTVWVFSSENKGRAEEELKDLYQLFSNEADTIINGYESDSSSVKFKFIGDTSIFPKKLQNKIKLIEAQNIEDPKINLNIAMGYGGRNEIVDAVKEIINENKNLKPKDLLQKISEENIDKHIYNQDSPVPDFLIRTSGEIRLSGFLLWQSAYSEYYFTDVLWPEFRKVDFLRALRNYQGRKRRFGK